MSVSSIIIMIIFVVCVVFQIMTLLFLVGAANNDAKDIDADLDSMDKEIRIAHADITTMSSRVHTVEGNMATMTSHMHELATNVALLGLRAMKEDQGEWWPEDHYRLVVGNRPAIKGRSCVHIRQHMQKEERS